MGPLPKIQYMIVGDEVGEQGTPHWQGFLRLSRDVRFSCLKASFPQELHWEKCRGSDQQNVDYCSKEKGEDKIHTWGELQGQGKRNDLKRGYEAVMKEGKSYDQLFDDEDTFAVAVKYPSGMKSAVLAKKRKDGGAVSEKVITWRAGPAGSGKTHDAYMTHVRAGRSVFIAPQSWPNFMEGYQGEEVVIFDDEPIAHDSWHGKSGEKRFRMLLHLTDVYPREVNVKGGSMPWLVKYVEITCEKTPQELWGVTTHRNRNNTTDQMLRRIGTVRADGLGGVHVYELDEEEEAPAWLTAEPVRHRRQRRDGDLDGDDLPGQGV